MKTFGKITVLAFIVLISACKPEDISSKTGHLQPSHVNKKSSKYTPTSSPPMHPKYIQQLIYKENPLTPIIRKRKNVS